MEAQKYISSFVVLRALRGAIAFLFGCGAVALVLGGEYFFTVNPEGP